jgi:hypothetical protein
MLALGACWAQAYLEEIYILKENPRMRKVQNGRKRNMCEENMKGVHARKPNHIRVRVFVR